MSDTSYESLRRLVKELQLLKQYYEDNVPGGNPALVNLVDVEITNLQGNDTIVYDAVEEKFVNIPKTSSGLRLSDLVDVSISSPSDKQELEYDATLQKYKNGSAKAPISSVAPRESDPTASSRAYSVGDYLYVDDTFYKVTTAINIGDAISSVAPNNNVEATTFCNEFSLLVTTIGSVNTALNSLFGE